MAVGKYDENTINEVLKYAETNGVYAAAKKFNVGKSTIYYHQKKHEELARKKTSMVITPISKVNEVKDNPFISVNEEKIDREYKRGEIYYVHRFATTGSEMATGRPAIIVSNDRLNKKTDVVEVVFLTTKNKAIAPEHFSTKATGNLSTVLAEQITTVDKARLGDFIGVCTPEDMNLLNKALLVSLGLEKYMNSGSDDQVVQRIASIKAERDAYKHIYDELFEKYILERGNKK